MQVKTRNLAYFAHILRSHQIEIKRVSETHILYCPTIYAVLSKAKVLDIDIPLIYIYIYTYDIHIYIFMI